MMYKKKDKIGDTPTHPPTQHLCVCITSYDAARQGDQAHLQRSPLGRQAQERKEAEGRPEWQDTTTVPWAPQEGRHLQVAEGQGVPSQNVSRQMGAVLEEAKVEEV